MQISKGRKQIKLIIFTIFSILISFIILKEYQDLSWSKSSFILLGVFLIITFIFNQYNYFSFKNSQHKKTTIINANFNYALIFLTNPIYSLIYSIGYGLIEGFHYKDKELAFFAIIKNYLSTYIVFFLIHNISESNTISLEPKFILVLGFSFILSIFVERCLNSLYLFIDAKLFSFSELKNLLIKGYLESFFITLFSIPIIVIVYDLFGLGGLIFPIGLIFVMTYTFKTNIGKQMELEEFKERSYRDGLTGLYNRRYLEEFLENINKEQRNMAVIMLDIDKFKSINDGYNHSVGDQVLKHFSKVLQKCVRQYDMIARYGGEEFTLVLPDLTPEQSKIVAERIRASVEASFAPVKFNGKNISVHYTTSVGLCYCHAERSFSLKDAVKEADKLLYISKKSGRNRVTANI